MAASAKRKQEEKHLKMLREMTSQPPNRKCFDCDQRGPTYANMTVGSFVCTSCSGILRGLNPPHRVKSISMTTFTQQEIEFLQKHGNELCKQIWLGLYDDRSSSIPDFREPQKVKEFLQEKYEKKRWYVPAEQARVVASVHASVSGSSASSTSSTPEVRPLKSLLGETAPALHLNRSTPSQSPVVSHVQAQQPQQFQQDKKQFDLLSDLGGDIFAAPAPAPAPTSQSTGSANFANFANFNSHTGASGPMSNTSSAPSVTAVSASSQPSSVGGDKYAALAELDSVFSAPAPTSNVYNAPSNVSSNVFGPVTGASQAQTQSVISGIPAGFGAATSTNPFMAPSAVPLASAPTNPFQSNGRAAAAAAGAGFGAFGQAKPGVTPFGQVMTAPGMSSNPFMAGALPGQYPSGSSSTNPFL
ncbi:arf-GAP domain and FG repeat-containing protein 1-like isoform X5 [Polyodon spathula]|uniref:arf-GAP domain and FG repeat-containing protein 1-like isoform X5 n=1 Tax=Polyodon spathula TaxID=7913 RepID=UPI001B7E5315|nr:arf-GAP domain and FG repeat-containing protein 1-like isoform X5 [Polyodon spathula]